MRANRPDAERVSHGGLLRKNVGAQTADRAALRALGRTIGRVRIAGRVRFTAYFENGCLASLKKCVDQPRVSDVIVSPTNDSAPPFRPLLCDASVHVRL